MRTHNIPSCLKNQKDISIKPPDLALISTLIGSNYPCLELIFMVPTVFEPLKFDCKLGSSRKVKNSLTLEQWTHARCPVPRPGIHSAEIRGGGGGVVWRMGT